MTVDLLILLKVKSLWRLSFSKYLEIKKKDLAIRYIRTYILKQHFCANVEKYLQNITDFMKTTYAQLKKSNHTFSYSLKLLLGSIKKLRIYSSTYYIAHNASQLRRISSRAIANTATGAKGP